MITVSKRASIVTWTLLGLVVLGAAAVRLRLLDVPLNRDEGEYAYFGQLLLQGIPPYTTAYNFKLPGIYAVYAGILATFGQTPTGVHLGLLVANIAGCTLTVLLATRLFTPTVAVLAGATFAVLSLNSRLHGLTAEAEHFVLLPALAGALALLSAVESRRLRAFFASGVLFGLAFMTKQNGAAFVLFGVLYALLRTAGAREGTGLVRRLAPSLVLLGGGLLPYGVLCLALALVGAFENFWFWTTVYAYYYASNLSLADGLTLFGLAFTSGAILATTYLVVALAAVGAAVLVWDRKVRSPGWFVGLFVLCSFAGTAAGLHFRPQYFLLLVPSVALLAGIAVDAAARGLRTRPPLLRIGVPLALAVLPLAHLVYTERTVFFELAPERVARAIWGINPFPESIEIARYIKARTAEGDRIAVLGSEPEIYFYAHRPAATGFIYTYALLENHRYASHMQRQMISEIDAAKPKFVVVVNVRPSWLERSGAVDLGWLSPWWGQYHQDFERVGVADIGLDRTTYAWGADAIGYTAKSVSVDVFERKRR